MSNKALAAEFRKAMKGLKIDCRVFKTRHTVELSTPAYEQYFTAEQIEAFCNLAISLGYTFVRALKIDPKHQAQLVCKHQWSFYPSAAALNRVAGAL